MSKFSSLIKKVSQFLGSRADFIFDKMDKQRIIKSAGMEVSRPQTESLKSLGFRETSLGSQFHDGVSLFF
jgi:hypothetical protein